MVNSEVFMNKKQVPYDSWDDKHHTWSTGTVKICNRWGLLEAITANEKGAKILTTDYKPDDYLSRVTLGPA